MIFPPYRKFCSHQSMCLHVFYRIQNCLGSQRLRNVLAAGCIWNASSEKWKYYSFTILENLRRPWLIRFCEKLRRPRSNLSSSSHCFSVAAPGDQLSVLHCLLTSALWPRDLFHTEFLYHHESLQVNLLSFLVNLFCVFATKPFGDSIRRHVGILVYLCPVWHVNVMSCC